MDASVQKGTARSCTGEAEGKEKKAGQRASLSIPFFLCFFHFTFCFGIVHHHLFDGVLF